MDVPDPLPIIAPREIVLLSGHHLRRLLDPTVVIAALREAYAALADNRGDQSRSVGFMIEGGSIHVKSGLLPGSHLAFAAKVNVNLPENRKRYSTSMLRVRKHSREQLRHRRAPRRRRRVCATP